MIVRSTDVRSALRSRQRGFFTMPGGMGAGRPAGGGGGGTDPLFAFVKYGSNFTGANGATTATDFSTSARTITFNGDAKISTAASAFGAGSSLLFDGNGDYLTMPDSADWTPGAGVDFCWEGVVNPASNFGVNADMVNHSTGSTEPYPYRIYRASGTNGGVGVLMFDAGGSLVANTVFGNLVTGSWSHWAVMRDGANLRVKINGAATGVVSLTTGALANATGQLNIGAYNTTAQFDGRFQQLRYTLGNARYGGAGSYTPPSALFPTS